MPLKISLQGLCNDLAELSWDHSTEDATEESIFPLYVCLFSSQWIHIQLMSRCQNPWKPHVRNPRVVSLMLKKEAK